MTKRSLDNNNPSCDNCGKNIGAANIEAFEVDNPDVPIIKASCTNIKDNLLTSWSAGGACLWVVYPDSERTPTRCEVVAYIANIYKERKITLPRPLLSPSCQKFDTPPVFNKTVLAMCVITDDQEDTWALNIQHCGLQCTDMMNKWSDIDVVGVVQPAWDLIKTVAQSCT